MRSRRLWGAVALGLTVLVGVAPAAAAAPPTSSPRRHHVIDRFVVPRNVDEAGQLAFDLDGDAEVTPDNVFGAVLPALVALVAFGSPQESADAGIASGQTLDLVSIAADSLVADPSAWWRSFIARTKTDPVLTGGGRFKVDGTAPKGTWLKGAIANRRLAAKGGTISLRLAVLPDVAPLTVRLVGARVKARCTASGCTNGILGGGVPSDELLSAFSRSMAAYARGVVDAGCPSGWSAPSDCDPDAMTVLTLFDKPPTQDKAISDVEVQAVLSTFLVPDLDLFGADGKRGTDGVDDAVSFGIGFTTKPAIFTEP